MKLKRKIVALIAALTLGTGAAVAVPMSASAHTGTLSVNVTCEDDGSATALWSLHNDYHTEMTVTTSDNASIPANSTVAANSTATFTQTIAAPAAGVTVSASLALHWESDGYVQQNPATASATVAQDCSPPPPTAICEGADVDWRNGLNDVSWEIHLGRQVADRNSPALYKPTDFGGLVSIVGFDDNMGNGDNVYVHMPEDQGATNVYTFADGTKLTALVSGDDCAPTIMWTITEAVPSVTFSHSEVCGAVTLGVHSEGLKSTRDWYYGLKAEVNGTVIGSVILKNNGDKSVTLTLPEDSYGGTATVNVYVYAATEWDYITNTELNYQEDYPTVGDHFWPIEVNTDCEAPVQDASAAIVLTDETCTEAGGVSLGAISNATWGELVIEDGHYSVTATADKNHAFDGGAATLTLSGDLPAATGFQNSDAEASCYVAPREDDVTVEEAAPKCDATEIEITTTTISYTLDTVTGELVAGEPVVTHSTRAPEKGEVKACPPNLAYTGADTAMLYTGGAFAIALLIGGTLLILGQRKRHEQN